MKKHFYSIYARNNFNRFEFIESTNKLTQAYNIFKATKSACIYIDGNENTALWFIRPDGKKAENYY